MTAPPYIIEDLTRTGNSLFGYQLDTYSVTFAGCITFTRMELYEVLPKLSAKIEAEAEMMVENL